MKHKLESRLLGQILITSDTDSQIALRGCFEGVRVEPVFVGISAKKKIIIIKLVIKKPR